MKQTLINILVVVLVILIGVFLLNVQVDRDATLDLDDDAFIVDSITAFYSYDSGIHEYKGTVELPNSCYALSTEAIVRESYPEQVTLLFTTDDGGDDAICAQVIKSVPFRILFTASPEAVVNATFNGIVVDLKAIPSDAVMEDGTIDNIVE